MKIHGVRRVMRAGRVRAEAEVEWESGAFPTRTLYFETSEDYADSFEARPESFLMACVPLACWYGEARVQLRGPICPVLFENAAACAHVMRRFYPELRPPKIEVELGLEARKPPQPTRTAAMMSGGVDALALLRMNRLDYPLDHPHSIREAVCVFGLHGFDHDVDGADGADPVPERLAAWEMLFGRLAGLAEREKFSLVPLYTNVRSFCPDYLVWSTAVYSPLTVAGVHCLTGRFDRLLLASDGVGVESEDCAASQYLYHCFSSAALDVHGELDVVSRQERLELLSQWEEGRALMQPCHWVELPEPDEINCGHCEKCVRTMLGLLLTGTLEATEAFPADDVAPELVERLWIASPQKLQHVLTLAEPLRRAGRRDLVRALRRLERRTQRRWEKPRTRPTAPA
ncbi:MAG: hypothetical protein MJE66_09400 [Proteobacteria bacterium]|nr:hypothetical protein [Pseudomonadota bacterium]